MGNWLSFYDTEINEPMNLPYFLQNTFIITLLIILLTGCATGPEPTPTPTAEPTYEPVPTYTPTPETTAAPTAPTAVTVDRAFLPTTQPIPTKPLVDTSSSVLVATTVVSATASSSSSANLETSTTLANTDVATTPTATPAGPLLAVSAPAINVRGGPDTTFEIVGAANQGETFDLLARSADGGWWQVCCFNGQEGWIYGDLATVTGAERVAVAAEIATPVQPTAAPVAVAPTTGPAAEPVAEEPVADTPAEAPAAIPEVDPYASSAGDFNPDAQYQIVHFKVRGLGENNGGIRDSGAQHHIFLTVLDANGNGVDGVVVENLVGEHETFVTGSKGPGRAEITMYWEPFKLRVASDPGGPVTSQTSNQMGLAFPHLPDLVGKLGDENYEYGACPTIDIKCEWPIQAIHYSYEITFQKVK